MPLRLVEIATTPEVVDANRYAREVVAVEVGLMAGRGLADVADGLGVSMNTVRTHLKRIFEKTRTCRQGELVGMLLRAAMAR